MTNAACCALVFVMPALAVCLLAVISGSVDAAVVDCAVVVILAITKI